MVVTLVLPEKAIAEAVAIVAVTELIVLIVDCLAVEVVLRQLGHCYRYLVPASRGIILRTNE